MGYLRDVAVELLAYLEEPPERTDKVAAKALGLIKGQRSSWKAFNQRNKEINRAKYIALLRDMGNSREEAIAILEEEFEISFETLSKNYDRWRHYTDNMRKVCGGSLVGYVIPLDDPSWILSRIHGAFDTKDLERLKYLAEKHREKHPDLSEHADELVWVLEDEMKAPT